MSISMPTWPQLRWPTGLRDQRRTSKALPTKGDTNGPGDDRGGPRRALRAVLQEGRGGVRRRGRQVRARQGEGHVGEAARQGRGRSAGGGGAGPLRTRP